MNSPWIVKGDFNVILSEEERIGGLPDNPNEYENFVFCLNSCKNIEINFKSSPYTL